MQDETFGEITFGKPEPTVRIDMEPYRRVIAAVMAQPPEEGEAKFKVLTGPWYPEGSTNAGRGKLELADERGLKAAAYEIPGKSAKIGHKHVDGGYTQLRVQVVNKREFSDEQVLRRTQGLAKNQVKVQSAKLASLNARLQSNPGDTELKREVDDTAAKVKKYQAIAAGKPATGATKKAQ